MKNLRLQGETTPVNAVWQLFNDGFDRVNDYVFYTKINPTLEIILKIGSNSPQNNPF